MRFQNRSRYPDAEVRALVQTGTRGVNLVGVAVHVKNCGGAYRGRAYAFVPRHSSVYGVAGITRLITIGLGLPSAFPHTNLVTTYTAYRDMAPEEAYPADPRTYRGRTHIAANGRRTRQVALARTHPYGGVRSPLIVCHTWQEALVAVAAHEACHIRQFQRRAVCSEVDAELWADARLRAWRAAQAADGLAG